MFWINHIPYEQATGELKRTYQRIKGPDNNIDNILMSHSLRPHTLKGHMVLYKSVLHHSGNSLPKWYLEALGVYVSFLNSCDYCVQHHYNGLKRLWNDPSKSKSFLDALDKNLEFSFFQDHMDQGFRYAKKLTQYPDKLNQEDIENLRKEGFSDGEILEINQVVSYFNYANRTVLGLGVHTHGDILGLSPNNNDDPENWNHR